MRCATAIPGIAAALEMMVARRLHAHPRGAALSAILRGDDGDRQRRGVRRAGADALAAGAANAAALLRRSALYRGAADAHRSAAQGARFRARAAAAELPRHAAANARAWRSRTTAIAARPRGCSAKRSAAKSMSPSSRSSAARSGWSPRPTRRWPAYPRQGVKRVAVAAPGFSADCIETLEELGIRGRKTFIGAGGEQFRLARLPQRFAAKASPCWSALVRRELAGWLPQS